MNDTPRLADTPFPLREKLLATSAHLLMSAAAVGALLYLAIFVWYPDFLFETDGGWQGLRIVVLVDLVLGPLLTFVVFKRGKKGLMTDLGCIGLLQFAALFGGAWVVYAERPLALVLHEGRLFSVTVSDYESVGEPVPDMRGLTEHAPHRAVLLPPDDPNVQSPIRTDYLGRKQFIYTHVPWMRPLAQHPDLLAAAAVPYTELAAREAEEDVEIVDAWLSARGLTRETAYFVPYSSRFSLVFLGVRRADGALLGALDLASYPD